MKAAGDIYLDRYEGWYSVRDEAFYDEKELIEGEGDIPALSPGDAGRVGGGRASFSVFRHIRTGFFAYEATRISFGLKSVGTR